MPSPTETLYAAHRLVAVTPHDTNDQGLAGCRALYVVYTAIPTPEELEAA